MFKDYIRFNCLTKTGKLNNRSTIKSWWENRSSIAIYEQIFEATSFLPTDCKFSERMYCVFHDIDNPVLCKHCKAERVSFKNFTEGYFIYCSTSCSTKCPERNEKISRNNDYSTISEKVRNTNIRKYGVPYSTQTSIMKEKTKRTKLERYGDEYYSNKNQRIQTNLNRYGVEHCFQNTTIQLKITNSIQSRTPELWSAEWLQEQNQTKSLTEIANELGLSYRTVWLAFQRMDIEPNFFRPDYNKLQNEIACSIPVKVIQNDRNILKPKEIDIWLPDHNLGIELNGIFWHSFDYVPTKDEANRHWLKTQLAEEKGIHLIQIWDDEWYSSQEIVRDIINRAIGRSQIIFGRKTKISKIDTKIARNFLEDNHLQGYAKSSVRYGLFYDDDLVSVMTFGKSRFHKDNRYELIRASSKIGIHVTGGFEKLFQTFLKDYNPESVISYCDRRIFRGNLYSKLGFVKISHSLDYWWVKNNKRIPRYQTQKHKLSELLDMFDPDLTEDENMLNNGYRKLFGCGHDLFVYKK